MASPSGAFLPLPLWGFRCGDLIGGKNVKFLMGTTVFLGLWLCFWGFVGLFSATEYFEGRWRAVSAPSPSISSSSKRFDVVFRIALRTGRSEASFCRAATAGLLQDPMCWFNIVDFLKLLCWPTWDSQRRSAMLAELSALGTVGSTDKGVGLSASLCFGFLHLFCVRSMQLSGATLAQPWTCCKMKYDVQYENNSFDMF